jgi:hypothetical protein
VGANADAVLGQPFLLQTRRIAPPNGGLLIACGLLVSGGAVLGEWATPVAGLTW